MAQASATIRNHPRCGATRRDGQPCGAAARASGFCFSHDPALEAERRAARTLGGQNKSTAIRAEHTPLPSYLKPVLGSVLAAIRDVRAGTLSPAQGSSIAALAGVAVRLVTAGQLEERLSALEAQTEGARTA